MHRYGIRFSILLKTGPTSITGIKYSDDPGILMIELYGEIPPNTNDASFFHNALSYLRSVDHNHLISSGGFLNINYNSGIDWKSIMMDPDNQVCDLEVYSSGDRNISVPNVSGLCKSLGKPWFLSAWSSCYQVPSDSSDISHFTTDTQMASHADDMYSIAKGASPAAMASIGSDFWNLKNSQPKLGNCDLNPNYPAAWIAVQNGY